MQDTEYYCLNHSTKIKHPEYPGEHSTAVRKRSISSQDRWSKVRQKFHHMIHADD